MKFTILNDQYGRSNYSCVCNNCLTDEQLEQAYSETEVGCCDECGAGPAMPLLQPIIVALVAEHGRTWARFHGVCSDPLLVATEAYDSKQLEGRVIDPGAVILLPDAERGQAFAHVEAVLQRLPSYGKASLGSGSISNLRMQVNTIIDPTLYSKYLYGTNSNTNLFTVTGVAT